MLYSFFLLLGFHDYVIGFTNDRKLVVVSPISIFKFKNSK